MKLGKEPDSLAKMIVIFHLISSASFSALRGHQCEAGEKSTGRFCSVAVEQWGLGDHVDSYAAQLYDA